MKSSIAKLIRLVVVTTGIALPAQAQQPQGAPALSAVEGLLKRAQDAFNDLEYARADSLARQVIAMGDRLAPAHRTLALFVIAASYYPEERAAQKPQLAVATLRQIFRTNLGARIPTELTWRGLDSLADATRRSTFGVETNAERQQVVIGPDGRARLSVRASRTASFSLRILPVAGGEAVVIDSLGPAMQGEFHVAAVRNARPVFRSGAYDVIVTAIDRESRDTIVSRYVLAAEAPAITWVEIPAKLDSSGLLPERSKRYGVKSVFAGALVGGSAFALSSVLRASGDIKSNAGADTKGIGVAALLATTTVVAGFLDKGRPLPANVAQNKTYAAAFERSVADANAENRRRILEYRATFQFEPETR